MEARVITLTPEKAKEFYKKGGELRDLALSAYTEEELLGIMLPKTWEEFCKNYKVQKDEYFISSNSTIEGVLSNIRLPCKDSNLLPNKQAAEAHLALMQLHQLRDCYRQGWIPNISDDCNKYGIKWNFLSLKEEPIVVWCNHDPRFLSFPTYDMASEFLTNFRELIKQAGDLI